MSEHEHGEHLAHPAPLWQLALVFGALIFLTVVTVAVAHPSIAQHLGRMGMVVAMVIATVKATLVVLFFMHMIHDKPFNAIVFLSSLLFLFLFVALCVMDSGAYEDQVTTFIENQAPPAK